MGSRWERPGALGSTVVPFPLGQPTILRQFGNLHAMEEGLG